MELAQIMSPTINVLCEIIEKSNSRITIELIFQEVKIQHSYGLIRVPPASYLVSYLVFGVLHMNDKMEASC
jgi:hypothetical protein